MHSTIGIHSHTMIVILSLHDSSNTDRYRESNVHAHTHIHSRTHKRTHTHTNVHIRLHTLTRGNIKDTDRYWQTETERELEKDTDGQRDRGQRVRLKRAGLFMLKPIWTGNKMAAVASVTESCNISHKNAARTNCLSRVSRVVYLCFMGNQESVRLPVFI